MPGGYPRGFREEEASMPTYLARPERLLACAALAVCLLPGTVLAQADEGVGLLQKATTPGLASDVIPPEGSLPWRYTLGAGGSYSSGNSASRSLSLTVDAVKESATDKLTLYGRALHSEDTGETTADQFSAGVRYDWNINPTWFHFGMLDWLRDRPANLAQRWSINSGFGYHVFRRPEQFIDLIAGIGYSNDDYVEPTLVADEVRTSYGRAELLFGQRSDLKLTDTTSVNQRVFLLPNLEDADSFRAIAEAGISVAMNSWLALTTSVTYRYSNDPGVGVERYDLMVVTGITMKRPAAGGDRRSYVQDAR
jgi:putative salt-induced outer membrane protein YdiY